VGVVSKKVSISPEILFCRSAPKASVFVMEGSCVVAGAGCTRVFCVDFAEEGELPDQLCGHGFHGCSVLARVVASRATVCKVVERRVDVRVVSRMPRPPHRAGPRPCSAGGHCQRLVKL
jgi:hypothetical protein